MKRIITILLSFSVLGISAQDTLTIGEVYDFEIGDEFHYIYDYGNLQIGQREKVIIEDKWYSTMGDTIYYYRETRKTGGTGYGDAWDDTVYDTLVITYLDSIIRWNNILSSDPCPLEDTCVVELSFGTLDALEFTTLDCGDAFMQTYYAINYNPPFGFYGWFDIYTNTYSQGLGLVSSVHNQTYDTGTNTTSRNLHYYNKDGTECGELLFTGIEEVGFSDFYHISPNPVIDILNIMLHSNITNYSIVKIYDIHGKLLVTEQNDGQYLGIDLSDLKCGSYILTLSSDMESYSQRFIKL